MYIWYKENNFFMVIHYLSTYVFTYILMCHNMIILIEIYLILTSQIVFYFFAKYSGTLFYIDLVMTLSIDWY